MAAVNSKYTRATEVTKNYLKANLEVEKGAHADNESTLTVWQIETETDETRNNKKHYTISVMLVQFIRVSSKGQGWKHNPGNWGEFTRWENTLKNY